MPSLQALEEFKSSFSNIGGERQVMAELELPFDDLPLPDYESAASESAESEEFAPFDEADGIDNFTAPETGEEPDFMNFGDLSDLLGGADSSSSDFDDTVFDEPNFEDPADSDAEINTAEENLAEESFTDFIDTIPTELLDGFADEMEAEDTPSEDFSSFDFEEFEEKTEAATEAFDIPEPAPKSDVENMIEDFPDLGSAQNMELLTEETDAAEAVLDDTLPETGFEPAAEAEDFTNFEDFHITESLGPGDENIPAFDDTSDDLSDSFGDTFGDALPDISFPETTEEIAELEAAELGSAEEIPELEALPVETYDDFSIDDEDSFGAETDSHGYDSSSLLDELQGDSFDSFSLGAEAPAAEDFALSSEDFALASEDFSVGSEAGGTGDPFAEAFDPLDDFSLPGIDDVPAQKTYGKTGSRKPAGKTPEVEEITLSIEELSQLQETLSSYPLNLRIACQELIAEHAVNPVQMSHLVNLLINGTPAAETAALAGKILGRPILIPPGFEMKTGEALEEEQSSFAYIFVHNFLPILKICAVVSMALLCLGFFCWRFIITPIRADRIYRAGLERIEAGQFARANERFWEAFSILPRKSWFYTYARAFRDARQFTLAEQKYQELLFFTASRNRRRIPERAAVLEYADMLTNWMGNFEAADRLIRRNILDFFPADRDALLALGDNALAWGQYEPERLEIARESFARYIEHYGRSDPLLERMLLYFIRTDVLSEVLALQAYFMASARRTISAATLAELGGYLLDKRYGVTTGVPDAFLDNIGGIREVLLRAAHQDPWLPESYYHLARYYYYFNNLADEQFTLEVALRAFALAEEESPRRISYHINALYRYAEILIEQRYFFRAEEYLIRGINVYQNALNRRLLQRSPQFGRLFASLGDLEFFVKEGNLQNAIDYYRLAEQHGWAPPEMHFRMGAAHYQLRQWDQALDRLFTASRQIPLNNRRMLHALGNISFMRGDYHAAQGYFDRLLQILEDDRSRLPPIPPTDNEAHLDLAERLMVVQNNLGVTLEALALRTGNHRYRSRAHGLFSDSARAWDTLTRDPIAMTRMRPSPGFYAPGINPAFLNIRNSLYPVPGNEPHFFVRIDRDVLEPSVWESLAPAGHRLSEGVQLRQ